jgi:hypothetical protein
MSRGVRPTELVGMLRPDFYGRSEADNAGLLEVGRAEYGSVLTADGIGGGSWLTGGMFFIIEEQVLEAAEDNITFSNIPQVFRHLRLETLLRSDRAAESDYPILTVNADGGNNYDRFVALFAAAYSAAYSRGVAPPILSICEAANSTASRFTGATIYLPFYRAAAFKVLQCYSAVFGDASADADLAARFITTHWRNTAAITSIALTPSIGPNFVAGSTAVLYGVM